MSKSGKEFEVLLLSIALIDQIESIYVWQERNKKFLKIVIIGRNCSLGFAIGLTLDLLMDFVFLDFLGMGSFHFDSFDYMLADLYVFLP